MKSILIVFILIFISSCVFGAESIKIIDPNNGAGTDYTSLASFESTEQADVTAATGSDTQFTAKCRCTGGTADVIANFNGWTTDAANYIKIWTDPAEGYRSTDGTYQTGNIYRIEGDVPLTLQEANIKVLGIELDHTGATTSSGIIYMVSIEGGGTIDIGYCILQNTAGASGMRSIFASTGIDSATTLNVFNTVAVNANGYSCRTFDTDWTVNFYNCSFLGGDIAGIHQNSGGTVNVENCAILESADDFSGTITITKCASDDNDAESVAESGGGTNWPDDFNDAANGDFTLVSGSNLIDAGTDDPSSGLYTDDIIGTTRSSYDIGAFEFDSGGGATFIPTINITEYRLNSILNNLGIIAGRN